MSSTRPKSAAPTKIDFAPVPFDFDDPPADPIGTFHLWYSDALRLPVPNPEAMALATVDGHGVPSARIVLLRGFDERGAIFFSNRSSRKGESLEACPRAALLFHWDLLHRQVRIEGGVTHTSDLESDEYWVSRPRENQLSTWASDQSHPVESRAVLEKQVRDAERRFRDQPVPRPPHWGGYRVSVHAIEFWEGHPTRLHDRVRYQHCPQLGGWVARRLSP